MIPTGSVWATLKEVSHSPLAPPIYISKQHHCSKTYHKYQKSLTDKKKKNIFYLGYCENFAIVVSKIDDDSNKGSEASGGME